MNPLFFFWLSGPNASKSNYQNQAVIAITIEIVRGSMLLHGTRVHVPRIRGGDNRVVADKRVINEAISVHDATLAVVTIKPYNRTIESRPSSRGWLRA